MILPLTLPSASSSSTTTRTLPPALAQIGSSEFFLLELQGELEVSGDKSGQLVGRLTIDDDPTTKGKPTLRIGHHLLEGKVVSLPKPLAILRRVRTPLAPDPDRNVTMHMQNRDLEDDHTPSSAAPNSMTSYTICALVRKKVVFSKRPTPIVGLSAKTMAAGGDTVAGANEGEESVRSTKRKHSDRVPAF